MPRKTNPQALIIVQATIERLEPKAVEVLWAIESERRILAEVDSPIAETAREALLAAANYVIQATAGDHLFRHHIEGVLQACHAAEVA